MSENIRVIISKYNTSMMRELGYDESDVGIIVNFLLYKYIMKKFKKDKMSRLVVKK